MKKKLAGAAAVVGLALASVVTMTGCGSADANVTDNLLKKSTGWTLVWSDEFDGAAQSKPNSNDWSYLIGNGLPEYSLWGWGTGESEFYTDNTENVHLDGAGHLVITALKPAVAGQIPNYGTQDCALYVPNAGGGPCRFTSGRIYTQNKVHKTYGRIEARIKFPKGDGIWPAFWIMGNDHTFVPGQPGTWPGSGEIDIGEYFGNNPTKLGAYMHSPIYSGSSDEQLLGDLIGSTDYSGDYHTYAIEWGPDAVSWYVDNKLMQTVKRSQVFDWVFDKDFFVILNMAIASDPNNPAVSWLGDAENTALPVQMLVDYVRWYQH